jgi:uncharacterized protein YecE (DUF72 family)
MQLWLCTAHPSTVACDIRIGTSGWHYRHWCGNFYPEKTPSARMLHHYLQHFDTAELNNSFYRLPTEAAFECWRNSVPENFVFAVKASRFLTHHIKLKDPEQALHNLLPRAELLGKKLGPFLFQLPPRWHVNLERLEHFLAALPRAHRYAFEFRDLSWHSPGVLALLRRFNVAFCIFHLAGFSSQHEITADFTYVRLHGPGAKYQGSYSQRQLKNWAETIAGWSARLKAVYVYFDNDQAGYAAQNALRLKQLVAQQNPLSLEESRAA